MFNKDQVFPRPIVLNLLFLSLLLFLIGLISFPLNGSQNIGAFVSVLIFVLVLAAFWSVWEYRKHSIQSLTAEMRSQSDMYRNIMESVPSAVVMVDINGTVFLMNSAAETFLGVDKGRVMGKNYSDISCANLVLDKGLCVLSFINDTLERGISYENFEVGGFLNGNQCTISISTKMVYDYFRNPLGVSLVLSDQTAVKILEEQLQKYECLSVVGQMAAGVAHEIRNPLQSMMSFVQLLQEKIEGNKEIFVYTDIVMGEIHRMNSIIGEFLQLSRPSNVDFNRHDLNSIVKDVVLLMESESILRNIVIEADYNSQIPLMMVDKAQLKQVVINLLSNAFAAMAHGGVATIKTWYDFHLNEACIEVSDNGVGMDAETLNQIGRPFFTTKDNGTGLGLAVSNRIINDHGGRIEISSFLGKGSIFTIKLPGLAGLEEVTEGFRQFM